MTPSPILKVLSIFKKHKVKSLLIGGQACIIYGATEFSRDSDFIILCNLENLEHLRKALKDLKAKLIYVPDLKEENLLHGHACHFCCQARGVENLRIDVISKLKGCDEFEQLWNRRNKFKLKNGQTIDVIGLEDLVQAKKTQRDKDWLMLKRLVEVDYLLHKNTSSEDKIKWWLLEMRTSEHLLELTQKYPSLAAECVKYRPLLSLVSTDKTKLDFELRNEELKERLLDQEYWDPLKKELEMLRHQALKAKT